MIVTEHYEKDDIQIDLFVEQLHLFNQKQLLYRSVQTRHTPLSKTVVLHLRTPVSSLSLPRSVNLCNCVTLVFEHIKSKLTSEGASGKNKDFVHWLYIEACSVAAAFLLSIGPVLKIVAPVRHKNMRK